MARRASTNPPKPRLTSIERARRYEQEFDMLALDNIFLSRDSAQLNTLMKERVYEERRYTKMPQYRRIAIQAYARGACDALTRLRLEKRTAAAEQRAAAAIDRANKLSANVREIHSVRISARPQAPAPLGRAVGVTPPSVDITLPPVLFAPDVALAE